MAKKVVVVQFEFIIYSQALDRQNKESNRANSNPRNSIVRCLYPVGLG
jgi:hypothetical protein